MGEWAAVGRGWHLLLGLADVGDSGFGVRTGLVGRWAGYKGAVGIGVVMGVWGVMLEINGMSGGEQGIGNRVLGAGAGSVRMG